MVKDTASVSGPGFSLLIHSTILLSLATASLLRLTPLPDPTRKHTPTPPLDLILTAGGGGANTTPAPLKGSTQRERPQPEHDQPAITRPTEPEAPVQPPTEVLPPPVDNDTQGVSSDDGPIGVPDGESGGAPDGSYGGARNGAGGEGGNGSQGFGGDGSTPGGPGTGDTLYLDNRIVPPVLIKKVVPPYPVVARAARLEATLRFEIVVDEFGDVSSMTAIKTHPLFEQSALDAIRQWKYRPATLGGRPVKVYLLVSVEFRLR